MSSERFFLEISGPTGKVVRLGDAFVTCQGIELVVSSICRPFDCEDIILGLAPVNSLLNGGNWYNAILTDCEAPGVFAKKAYSERPSIRLDYLDKVKQQAKSVPGNVLFVDRRETEVAGQLDLLAGG